MRLLAPSLLFCGTSCFLLHILTLQALAIRISGVRTGRGNGVGGGLLGKRAALFGSGGLQDDSDLKYYTNVTLNEEVFPMLIDTGRYVCDSKCCCP